MKPRIEAVAIDCLMLRLFESIDETHMPWMLAASRRLRQVFGKRLVEPVSYTHLTLPTILLV